MADGLVGFSGFVGSNLLLQRSFDALYRSTNVQELAGRTFDLLVCAGAPAEKWKANKDPEADRAALGRLTGALEQARARKVVLLSTVDVYPSPVGVDEATEIDPSAGSAYGRHRLDLERFVAERFDTLVVRLPALFGNGLKKNAVFDLLHDNMVSMIPSEGTFQFYGLDTLWADIERFLVAGLALVNVATEPVSMREVAHEAFGMEFVNDTGRLVPRYDFRTRYDRLLGGRDGYLQDRARVLGDLRRFVARERARRA